jgi:DegV family protein with EDD domain
MAVAIVTDSAAALPLELVHEHDITVVPMWLTIGDESVREGERDLGELLGDERVSTSAPAPGEFAAAIEKRRTDDGVLVLTIASTMSGTHNAAVLAADSVDGPVRVVDTQTAAGAEALVVLAAASAAEGGGDLDAVAQAATRAVERVRLLAMVPTLDHLVRSGRVPGIAGWAGRRLNITPMFEFRGGKVHRLRPAIGPAAGLDRIISRFRRSVVDGAALHVTAGHALAADDAVELLRRVEADFEPATSFVGEFGSVMVVHTGPGLVGLAWWWDGQPPSM